MALVTTSPSTSCWSVAARDSQQGARLQFARTRLTSADNRFAARLTITHITVISTEKTRSPADSTVTLMVRARDHACGITTEHLCMSLRGEPSSRRQADQVLRARSVAGRKREQSNKWLFRRPLLK
jgi:hypothetical protein